MNCGGVRRLVDSYVDGEVDAESSAAIRIHLSNCGGCSAHHRAAVSLPGRLRALPAPAAPDLVPAVMAAIRRGRMRRELSAALLAAEAVLVCLALVQLGLDGLLAAAAASLKAGSALFGGTADAPAPGDLGLVVTLLVLVAVSAVHLGCLGSSPSLRSRG
jgi:predicted anti-sigma-YlaC factor YlaD